MGCRKKGELKEMSLSNYVKDVGETGTEARWFGALLAKAGVVSMACLLLPVKQ